MADQRYFFLDLVQAGVQGGCQKLNHTGWIELDDWSFSMHQMAEPNVKGGRPSKTSAAGSFGFTIKHNGPTIFKLVSQGAFIGQPITFEAERAGLTQAGGAANPTGVYFRLVFNNTVISSRSISGDPGTKTEHIEFAFEKVTMTYRQVVNGVLGPAVTKFYDAKSNQAG
jgi:type VI protein secretion system component Hcp